MNFLLKVASIALVLYLFKSGTDTGARTFKRVVDWARGVVQESNLGTVARQVQLDYSLSGNFPADFPAWVRESVKTNDGSDTALDFWGTPLELIRNRGGAPGAFEVRSCGPDRACGTADDLVVRGVGRSVEL